MNEEVSGLVSEEVASSNDPRHADLAEEIRRLREIPIQWPLTVQPLKGKSESAKDAQIAHLKERVQKLEQVVRKLQQEK